MNAHKVTKTIVKSPVIYKPVGPYSQAILADKTLYVSGVLGMDPQAQLVCGGAEAQARQALDNLCHVLQAGGASLESVVKTTILLARMEDFQAVNQVYTESVWRRNTPLHGDKCVVYKKLWGGNRLVT
ncbi:hypothetical protein PYW07_013857 [Mythimna separata]|uniref:Uncharacterized protein n=1 Tax=Mythimna separata TaxID=271217 RepID=A0AAD7YF07_MYTSE|nr:hypothetical protein PYW07_013857 [Mythimna separata]